MKKMLLGVVLFFSCLLFSCNDNSSSGPDKKKGVGIEVPCNAENIHIFGQIRSLIE